jgi:hypothetical protein
MILRHANTTRPRIDSDHYGLADSEYYAQGLLELLGWGLGADPYAEERRCLGVRVGMWVCRLP